ncbi:MAG: N-terminal phage integrase SAM-like domain-containing protein, partial [Ruminococcus flavefaciens]|nr:N-terminal phage integrase SAM-like domain-containing protein [Ruminococcus flavefaciens]
MPKRGENIRKRKDGRWEARILTSNGKHKSVYADSYYAVKEKIKNPQEKLYLSKTTSFSQLCDEWLKTIEIKNKQSTIAIYKGIINKHILPYFGHMNTNKIEINHVNTFIRYKTYQNKLQASTIGTMTAVLIQIIKYGEKQEYIRNFRYDLSIPTIQRKELEILTESEQERLVSLIKETITHESIGILLSLYAGLRIGEICA